MRSGSFDLHNTGDEPLEFRLVASCNCSELDPANGVIPPNGRQTVRVAMQLKGEGGESVTVRILTNEPNQPDQQYTLSATSVPELVVAPRSIDFGTIPVSSEPSSTTELKPRVIEITVKPGETDEGEKVRLDDLRVQSSSKYLSVDKAAAEGQVVLKVALAQDVPRGRLSESITLTNGANGTQVVVAAVADVVGQVTVAPTSLRLTDRPDDPVTFVVWRPDGSQLGPVTELTAPKGVKVEEVSPNSGAPVEFAKRRTFRARTEPGAGKGKEPAGPAVIRVVFKDLPEPVVVRVNR